MVQHNGMHNFKIKEYLSCSVTTKKAKNTENEMLRSIVDTFHWWSHIWHKRPSNLLSRWDLGTIQTDVLLMEKEAKII